MVELFSTEIYNRNNMSEQFIGASAFFARKSFEIEQSMDIGRKQEHKYYVIGTIYFAYSFVDSAINEFYEDIVENHNIVEIEAILGTVKLECIKTYWSFNNKERQLNKKYNAALRISGKPEFKQNTAAPAEFDDVVKLEFLRNRISHYFPKSSNKHPDKGDDDLYDKLKNTFKLNPFYMNPNSSFFPDKCLSHGCAEWAVNSAIKFVNTFYSILALPTKLDSTKAEFQTR